MRKIISKIMIFGGIAIGLLFVFNLVVIALDNEGGGIIPDDLTKRFNYECEITVINELGSDPYILQGDCVWKEASFSNCFLNTQSIWSQEGDLKLYMNERVKDSAKVDIKEYKSETYKLQQNCLEAGTYYVEVQLIGENGALWSKVTETVVIE
jgi:hypothetical protein